MEETAVKKPEKKKKKTRIIWILIFIAVNVLVIGYTAIHEFGSKSPEKLNIHLSPSTFLFLLAAAGCAVGAILMETIKYLMMMKALKERVSLKAALQTATLGKYYDCITPSGIGGQPFQIYNMHKEGYGAGAAVAIPLMSFLTMQIGFIVLALFTFFVWGNIDIEPFFRAAAYFGCFCYALVPGFIILFTIKPGIATKLLILLIKLGAKVHLIKDPKAKMEGLVRSLGEYRDAIKLMSKNVSLLLRLLLCSVAYHFAIMCIPYFVLQLFNGSTSFVGTVAMTLFTYAAITFVPTPGNAGAAEGSFYIIFSEMDPSGLFWAMLIWRFFSYYLFIGFGVAVYIYNAVKARAKKKVGELKEKHQNKKNSKEGPPLER